jgi:hypothetical protein
VDPRLYRWQASLRGAIKDRDDIRGRGFLRLSSNRAGVLFYHGFARPPRNIYWQPLVDWSRKLGRAVQRLWARPAVPVAAGIEPLQSGVSNVLDSVIGATRVALVLVTGGLLLVLATRVLSLGPQSGPWLTTEYGATFLFIGAWMVVKTGILETAPTWKTDAWSQTLKLVNAVLVGLLLLGILHVWAGILAHKWHISIRQLLLWILVVWFFVVTSTKTPPKRKRRRRR